MSEAGAAPPGRRWPAPAGALLAAAACFALYERAPRAVAEGAIVPYAALLALAPAFVYPWLRRRGARPGPAAAGALAVYAAWLVKEGLRVGRLYGLGGALYYAANPLSVGILLFLSLQMAGAELVRRRLATGRWRPLGGAGVVLAGVAAVVGAMAAVAATSDPSNLFYAYIDLYARLLGPS